jgi:uncharacterized protein (UPF0248 family)
MALKSLQLMQQFWHDDRYELGKVQVWYVDRGAPDDLSSVGGLSLREPESKFFFGIDIITNTDPIEFGTKVVPYHRITRIEYDGKCLFERSTIPAKDLNKVMGR